MQQPAQAGSAATAQRDARMQLSFRQSELRDQLKELSRRRNELLEQRNGMPAGPAAEINARIAVIDRRSAQIETQLFAVNDAVANGYGGPVIASPPVDATPPPLPGGTLEIDQSIRDAVNSSVDDAVFGAFATVTTTMLALYVAWRGIRRFIWKAKRPAAVGDNSAQIEKLQQSMDVVAIEVERISEAQRYTAKLLNERGLGAGEAQPVPVNQLQASRVK